jgi:threonylcarbamoyladenosine tRNA methylthiotransferase MtaB
MKAEVPGFLVRAKPSPETAVLFKSFEPGDRFNVMDICRFPGRARAYLKIQDGCESFCSYCIVPFARGPYRSLPPEKVIRMLGTLSDQGYGEVVLTGIHLGKYGVDLGGGMDLVSLLRQIGEKGLPLRIRLSSIEPNEVRMGLIEMAASESWLCRHLHIPLQSGDDRVLDRMNRHYTAREFADAIEAIYTRIPHAAIGVDIMAGFPGENSAAHDNSYSLLKDLPVSYLHVFPFSPRPGTAASRFKGRVAPEDIKKRAARLRDLGEKKRLLFFQGCLNREFPVLTEKWESRERGLIQGRSDNYLPVVFPVAPDSAQGPVQVLMDRIEGRRLIGTVV